MTNIPIDVVSLGGWVQSSYVDIESRRGAFGMRPSVSIMADTGDEPDHVYAWVEEMKKQSGHPIVTVKAGNLMEDSLIVRQSKKTGNHYLSCPIPAYTLGPDGSRGLLGRKCTQDYKIAPIVSWIRELVGRDNLLAWRRDHAKALKDLRDAKEAKETKPIEAWDECQDDPLVRVAIGISVDEVDRVKPNALPWILNYHPLVDAGITREMCADRVQKATGHRPKRSACKKCPFHSDAEWLDQKRNSPKDFEESCDWEKRLQDAASSTILRGIPYLHNSMVPLSEVRFDDRPSHTQLDLFRNECQGLCGV